VPLKLNVGLSKKIGQPDYGSIGANCQIELEIEQSLLFNDLDGFHDKVRQAFVACNQAVKDELYRQQQSASERAAAPNGSNGNSHAQNGNGQGRLPANNQRPRRDNIRAATASQVRAIEAIAKRRNLQLDEILWNDFGYSQPGELSITEASKLIDDLKASANGQPNGQSNGHSGDSR
jgi:hypothetical protein